MSRGRIVAFVLAFGLTAGSALSCSHSIKNIYPEDQSRLEDNLVRFNWEDDNPFMPYQEYIVQLGLDPDFEGAQAKFKATKPSIVIDLVDTFGPAKSVLFYWRVKARGNGILWSDWSDSYSFLYDGKAQELKQLVALPPAPVQPARPAVEAPQYLIFGGPESISRDKTYSLTVEPAREAAAKHLAYLLWQRAKWRLVERGSIVEPAPKDDDVPARSETYVIGDDPLNQVIAVEEVLAWRTPDAYVVLDYYKLPNHTFLLFSRLVDVKSGIISWHHLEYVVQESETPETLGALLTDSIAAMTAALGSGRAVVLAETTENGRPSESFKQLALPYLVNQKSFATLLRAPPVARPVQLKRKLPGGEVEVLSKTYYKLYDKQFSVVARAAQQVWAEADEHIAIAYDEQTEPIDATLIVGDPCSDEQFEAFWHKPRKSISARFVETRTGRIRSIVTVVARDDVAWSALSLKLAETLTR